MVHRKAALQDCIRLVPIVALGCICSAQATQFTATPLFPSDRIASTTPKVHGQVQSRETPAATHVEPLLAPQSCTISVAPGASPAGGYLPLSGFGIAPVPAVDDDTVTNFNTPTFLYAGQAWSRVGFSSNGYVVIGGGNNTFDNVFTNTALPNPNPPNNILAPYWTDLNPGVAGAMRIGALTDGTDVWIVLDWEAVGEFSNTTHLHSFQVWIGTNTDAHPAEDITYAYGNQFAPPPPVTVGAENIYGNVGAMAFFNGTGTAPVNGTQLRVSTAGCPGSPPTIPTLDPASLVLLALLVGGLGIAFVAWPRGGRIA